MNEAMLVDRLGAPKCLEKVSQKPPAGVKSPHEPGFTPKIAGVKGPSQFFLHF